MSSSLSEMLDRVRALAPLLDQTAAERALSTTLTALGAVLTADEVRELAPALPSELSQSLGAAAPASAPPSGLFAAVAARERLPLGRAIELVQITLQALGEVLPVATRTHLERHLPELSPLLEPASPPVSPTDATDAVPRVTRDLAGGQPGSRRNVAEADPSILAHRHSVARSDDPHAETKLASAAGLAQEREQRTLAAGHPGSDRPLSGKRR
jgi:uncharacterized protein (DUF2267 family)